MHSPFTLAGRRALVTGGSKGIGRATVELFRALGAEVVFTARGQAAIDGLVAELTGGDEGHAPAVHGLAADVRDPADRARVATWIESRWGALDVAVHNAGTNVRRASLEYGEADYATVMETNLDAVFRLNQALHPWLVRGTAPAIVHVSSVAGSRDVGTGAPYAMSKAALNQLTRSLAVEWAPAGIRVNAVSPWFTATPLTKGLLAQPERIAGVLARTPLGRVAEAAEMASVIAFCAMPAASYLTGQEIVVDGGMSVSAR